MIIFLNEEGLDEAIADADFSDDPEPSIPKPSPKT